MRRLATRRALAGVALASAAACSAAPPQGGVVPSSGPPVVAPAGPGEAARTAAPGERVPLGGPAANAADVLFAERMIPHHAQALRMTALAASRGASRTVKALAARIEAAQGPEIVVMRSWLADQGRRPPDGHGHGAEPMPGMATPGQLDALAGASGEEFDRSFLRLMIAHHEGALTMAREVLRDGRDRRIRALARDVLSGQTAEISRMRALLR
ncbi:DUF305 domain-containing protein [Bailinhaonella thermotolerans]|uniref:DUF305 domain-containing protein n=1 Tax=Bailinhaonella thermotolerans TaxID=1070861 RepID=A0A3A4B628_9ACTN|nr:DUF305 domain-containing protein [Bailinhaonella thermotolerans]RJL34017.1 DUF305 domain-containing protein [Bailinhaonella thermotolerans]